MHKNSKARIRRWLEDRADDAGISTNEFFWQLLYKAMCTWYAEQPQRTTYTQAVRPERATALYEEVPK